MEHKLTKTELKYLKSLLSLIKKFRSELMGETVGDEIKLMEEVYKRKSITIGKRIDGKLYHPFDDEADLINSWKGWYIYNDDTK